MTYLEVKGKTVVKIRFAGDVHFGDVNSNRGKLKDDFDKTVREGGKMFLTGDMLNVAGRATKSSIVNNNFNEYVEIVEFLEPYKDHIIGAIDGNHEQRMVNDYGITPTQFICSNLKIPYCGTSCLIRISCGERVGNRSKENYFVYCHHTIGGGSTQGSKANVLTRMRDIVEGCDVYCGGHTHQLSAIPQDVYRPSMQGKRADKATMWFVGCGSYLEYEGGYAEAKLLSPATIGSPTVTFLDKEHKCLIDFN